MDDHLQDSKLVLFVSPVLNSLHSSPQLLHPLPPLHLLQLPPPPCLPSPSPLLLPPLPLLLVSSFDTPDISTNRVFPLYPQLLSHPLSHLLLPPIPLPVCPLLPPLPTLLVSPLLHGFSVLLPLHYCNNWKASLSFCLQLAPPSLAVVEDQQRFQRTRHLIPHS